MAVPSVITTPVTGTPISSTAFGIPVSADVNYLIAPPIFYGYETAVQTILNNTFTSILIDTEVVDSFNGHSTVTNTSRYVGQVAGYYAVVGKVTWSTNATGRRISMIYLNGVEVNSSRGEATAAATPSPSCHANVIVQLNGTTDYVEVIGYQNSGGSLATVALQCSLEVRWLHT